MPSAATALDTKHLHNAVNALLTHVERTRSAGKAQLLDENVPINVIVGTKVIPDTKGRTKPYMITLKHPLYDPEDTQTCLFVKDPQREYKDKLQKMGITSINRVIGVSKLRSKFKQYEAQRQLCSGYDLFFADDRVLPLLPHLIGKVFFEKKKQPLPVNMTRASLGEQFQRMLSSTPFYLSEGMCSTVKAGHTGMTAKQIAENIAIAVEKIATVVPKEWAGIQAIHIKTGDSIALPIYHSVQSLPGEPAEEGARRPAEAVSKKRKAGAEGAGEAASDRTAKAAKKGKTGTVEEKKAAATTKKEGGNGVPLKKNVPKTATPKTKAAPTPKKEETKAAPTPKKEVTKGAPTPKKEETKTAPTPKKGAPTPEKEETKAAPKSVTKTSATPKKVAATKAEPTPKKEAGKTAATPKKEVAATPKPVAKAEATPKSVGKAATPAVKGGVAKPTPIKSASKATVKISPGGKKSPSPAKMMTRKKAAASASK